jgi:mRNA interferase MazF
MNGGIMYEQKEIVLLPFPYSDLTGSKLRPAIIISNENLNKSEDRMCCLVTTQLKRNDLLIEKKDFASGELTFKSAVRPYRIFTINENIIRKTLCKVNNEFFDKLLAAINAYIKRE